MRTEGPVLVFAAGQGKSIECLILKSHLLFFLSLCEMLHKETGDIRMVIGSHTDKQVMCLNPPHTVRPVYLLTWNWTQIVLSETGRWFSKGKICWSPGGFLTEQHDTCTEEPTSTTGWVSTVWHKRANDSMHKLAIDMHTEIQYILIKCSGPTIVNKYHPSMTHC